MGIATKKDSSSEVFLLLRGIGPVCFMQIASGAIMACYLPVSSSMYCNRTLYLRWTIAFLM